MTVTILVVLSALVMVFGQRRGQTYCGRQLAAKLDALCNGQDKRSPPQYEQYLREQQKQGQQDQPWPWLARSSAHRLWRSKRQVVSECCDKPCTVDVLLLYCGN